MAQEFSPVYTEQKLILPPVELAAMGDYWEKVDKIAVRHSVRNRLKSLSTGGRTWTL